MARHASEAQKRAAAVQAGRRIIARGERLGYRHRPAQDGTWTVTGLHGVSAAVSRREALSAGRAAIAATLKADADACDLEA